MDRRKIAFLLNAAIVIVAGPAAAQVATSQPAAPRDGSAAAAGSDIVVTARRRDERLQETPVAVTALNAAALQQQAVFNVSDVGRLAPNLTIAGGRGEQGQSFIFIRGIGQLDDNPSVDPGVATYVDDVYLGRSQGGLFNLDDAAQIEVLRGPQGTLYGKNTIGGAIKVTSRIPGPTPEYVASVSYGNYDDARLFLALNHPLIDDKLFLRVSGLVRRRDALMDNSYSGQGLNNIGTMSGRLMLRYLATPSLDILLSVDGADDSSRSTGGRLVALANPPTALLTSITQKYGSLAPYVLQPGKNPYSGTGYDVGSDAALAKTPFSHTFGSSLRVGWTGGDLSLKSITAYRRLHDERVIDIDASPLTLVATADQLRQHQFSQEVQFNGKLANGLLSFFSGAYYFDEKLSYDTRAHLVPATSTDRNAKLGTRSYAGYLNVTIAPTSRLSATAGVRYTHEQRTIDTFSTLLNASTVTFGPIARSASFNDFSPKFEIDYKFTPDIFAYASVAKGFKSGGFNGRAGIGAQLDPFRPETAWTYEGGLKTQFLNRRLTLNFTGYHTNYRDLQETVYAAINGSLAQVVTNAASARIDGFEFEGNARLTNALTIFGNAGYEHAEYREFTDALLGNLSALKLPFVPKWTYMFGGRVDTPMSDTTRAIGNVDYSWHSAAFTDVPNTAALRQPAYGLLNARAGLRFHNGLEVALFGKNLTDKRVVQSGFSFLTSFGFATGYFTDPRTYGIEAIWKF